MSVVRHLLWSGIAAVALIASAAPAEAQGKGQYKHYVVSGERAVSATRTVRDRVMFEETEPSVLVDIDVKLKL